MPADHGSQTYRLSTGRSKTSSGQAVSQASHSLGRVSKDRPDLLQRLELLARILQRPCTHWTVESLPLGMHGVCFLPSLHMRIYEDWPAGVINAALLSLRLTSNHRSTGALIPFNQSTTLSMTQQSCSIFELKNGSVPLIQGGLALDNSWH